MISKSVMRLNGKKTILKTIQSNIKGNNKNNFDYNEYNTHIKKLNNEVSILKRRLNQKQTEIVRTNWLKDLKINYTTESNFKSLFNVY